MADWQLKIIAAEADRLIELAAEDAGLRGGLRALAQKILAATSSPQADDHAGPENPASEAAPVAAVQEEMPGDEPVMPAPEPLRELTLGRGSPAERTIRPSTATTIAPETPVDHITQLEAQCRRKAEAARWAAECQRRLRQGYDFEVHEVPSDPEIAAWADRLTDAFYWSNASDASRAADLSLLDDVGGCFEAVAEALSLVRVVADNPKVLEHLLPLIAEVQSALRAGLGRVGAADDADQVQVFDWLKATAVRHRIYIKRFMRADDQADPTRWPDLLSRIDKLAERHGPTGRRSGQEPLFNRLRVRLDVLRGSGSVEADWRAVIEAVEDIVSEGVPPSNRAIRDLLLPVINELPDIDDMPPGFRLVLREIDRFLATRSGTTESPAIHQPTAEVKAVARLLGGKSVVLIGGSRRRGAQESLERAFALEDLIWIETKEHQAVAAFEPLIARRDVALVLLAIRWSSHSFRDVKPDCDRHDKPLVRLPGGYNPNQVAAQILSQCSGQLESRAAQL